jgi:hypothetical protein
MLYFGGVPVELLFDQMKAVIIEDRPPGSERPADHSFLIRRLVGSAPYARAVSALPHSWRGALVVALAPAGTSRSVNSVAALHRWNRDVAIV